MLPPQPVARPPTMTFGLPSTILPVPPQCIVASPMQTSGRGHICPYPSSGIIPFAATESYVCTGSIGVIEVTAI
jgi:hypothetical protein